MDSRPAQIGSISHNGSEMIVNLIVRDEKGNWPDLSISLTIVEVVRLVNKILTAGAVSLKAVKP